MSNGMSGEIIRNGPGSVSVDVKLETSTTPIVLRGEIIKIEGVWENSKPLPEEYLPLHVKDSRTQHDHVIMVHRGEIQRELQENGHDSLSPTLEGLTQKLVDIVKKSPQKVVPDTVLAYKKVSDFKYKEELPDSESGLMWGPLDEDDFTHLEEEPDDIDIPQGIGARIDTFTSRSPSDSSTVADRVAEAKDSPLPEPPELSTPAELMPSTQSQKKPLFPRRVKNASPSFTASSSVSSSGSEAVSPSVSPLSSQKSAIPPLPDSPYLSDDSPPSGRFRVQSEADFWRAEPVVTPGLAAPDRGTKPFFHLNYATSWQDWTKKYDLWEKSNKKGAFPLVSAEEVSSQRFEVSLPYLQRVNAARNELLQGKGLPWSEEVDKRITDILSRLEIPRPYRADTSVTASPPS